FRLAFRQPLCGGLLCNGLRLTLILWIIVELTIQNIGGYGTQRLGIILVLDQVRNVIAHFWTIVHSADTDRTRHQPPQRIAQLSSIVSKIKIILARDGKDCSAIGWL